MWCPEHKALFTAVANMKTGRGLSRKQLKKLKQEKAKFLARTVTEAGSLTVEELAERVRDNANATQFQDAVELAVEKSWLKADGDALQAGTRPLQIAKHRSKEDRALLLAHYVHAAGSPVSAVSAGEDQGVKAGSLQLPSRLAIENGWISRTTAWRFVPGEVEPPPLPANT